MRPLGDRQREWLGKLASPGLLLIVGNKVTDSLVKRGLMASLDEDGKALFQITPAGLRALADEWEAGRCDFSPEKFGLDRRGKAR